MQTIVPPSPSLCISISFWLSACLFFLALPFSPFPAEKQHLKPKKQVICWVKEDHKWDHWNISCLKPSECHCLINHICDWRAAKAQLEKPSCHSARWSQCDILWTRQTEKWDGNICSRHPLFHFSPLLPPMSHCQKPLSSKQLTKNKKGEPAKMALVSAPGPLFL